MTFDEWVIARLREHGFYAGTMNGAPGRAMIDGLKNCKHCEHPTF